MTEPVVMYQFNQLFFYFLLIYGIFELHSGKYRIWSECPHVILFYKVYSGTDLNPLERQIFF